ncbi:MAG: hypothetical protein IT495_17080 [Gammaproteobacteria bacterium]|nr:hypothetical protein [Gammaproteobacteria bacterium]
MAKPPRNISPKQGDLFQRLESPSLEAANAADLDIGPELLGAVHAALREARGWGLSRERIVDRMNIALPELDRAITARQAYSWTAQSKEYHELPARYLPALCWALGSELPLRVLANALGYDLVDRRDAVALRLGQLSITRAQLTREERTLREQLGG